MSRSADIHATCRVINQLALLAGRSLPVLTEWGVGRCAEPPSRSRRCKCPQRHRDAGRNCGGWDVLRDAARTRHDPLRFRSCCWVRPHSLRPRELRTEGPALLRSKRREYVRMGWLWEGRFMDDQRFIPNTERRRAHVASWCRSARCTPSFTHLKQSSRSYLLMALARAIMPVRPLFLGTVRRLALTG